MKLLAIAGVLVVLGLAVMPAQDLEPWVLQLSRVKNHARANFERLPSYACLETITRSEKSKGAYRFTPLDTLRLEVALVGDQELFSRAGAASFDTRSPVAFIDRGAIGTGAFASEAHNLFVTDAARITARGEAREDGRAVLWYDFQISQMFSSFHLMYAGAQATVGEEGRFFVDAQSLDLLRVEARAVDIPPGFPIEDVATTITYATVRIGSKDAILPRTAEMLLSSADGKRQRNVTEFSGCREYTSQSIIRFDAPPAAPATPVPPTKK